jgi:AAA+ ATPase superfamily predicted ATPase
MGGKVIFTEKPRDNIENIFDRTREIDMIKKVLDTGDWLAILGPRMIGKTSIAKAILNEYKKDYNTLYIDLTGIKNSGDAINKIFNNIPKNLIDKFKDDFEIIGINIMGNSINFNKKINNTDVMESLFKLLSRKKTMIVLDEFQELSFGINHFINMLHNIMMENKNIIFIFTGSSIGLMKTLLEQEGKNPLAGRNPVKVVLEPWNHQTAFDYLKSGLLNCNININETEINEAINEIGTITGWLDFYGRRRCIYNHDDALSESLEEAVKVARYELNNIINKSVWKRKALKMMAFGSRYNEILSETKVSTSTLSNFLHRLEKLYLIKNDNRTYYIVDNIYRKGIK